MSIMRHTVVALGLAALALGLAACTGTGPNVTRDGRPSIVVTTTIWGDLVQRLVGEDATVEVLLQPGQDPHGFAPSARQAASLLAADLVVANGLGLEEGLIELLDQASSEGIEVLELAPLLDPIVLGDDDHADESGEEEGAPEDDHGPEDPHVWLDPVRVADAMAVLAERLAAIDDLIDDRAWTERGEQLAASISATHAAVEETLAGVPEDCRLLVTNHDSLEYFAARYGFEVIGTVIPGTSTAAEPSASDFAALVAQIRQAGVPAIFAETTESTRLAEALADEVGDVEVVSLYTGSVGEPGSGADTYEGMVSTNARAVADALSSCTAT